MTDEKEHYYPESENREMEHPTDLATDAQKETPNSQAPTDQGEESRNKTEETTRQEQFGLMGLVYGALFNPWRTFGVVARKPPVGLALLILLAAMVCSTLYGIIEMDTNSLDFSSEFGVDPLSVNADAVSGFTWSVFVLFIMFIYFIILFVYSGYLHLAGEILGGRGSARGVYVAVCLSQLPYVVAIPFMVLAPILGIVGNVLLFLIKIGVAFWAMAIQVIGMIRVLQLSTGRAILAVLSPILLVLLFIVLLLIIVSISIF